jgi:hypothetical protein
MQNDTLAPALRDLINRHLRSMDHVEALLHLAGAPDQACSVEAVAAKHRWSRGIAQQVLHDLRDTGAAVSGDRGFRIATDTVDDPALQALNQLYHQHPVTLVRAIYAAPLRVKPLIRSAPPDDEATSSG